MMKINSLLSTLPSIDEIIKSPEGIRWSQKYSREFVVEVIRDIINQKRQAILSGQTENYHPSDLLKEINNKLEKFFSFSLKKVINATGVVIHTNLGRAILSEKVMRHVQEIACNYSNLEYDIERGQRGKRYSHIQYLLSKITGAENALVVNNNAAAVLICLSTLAKGKEVIISRGELVEIGGSFRIPEVMKSSGAILKEVGTTNKTHLRDYEQAITENTALLLKVHQSNFRMIGFTESVSLKELVKLGKRFNLPVMFDLGSGCLIDLKKYHIFIEPSVREVLSAGIDIATFSGDKLLGGPQAGIITGKKELLEKISLNPLMRALRVDKMTLSALEATLRFYLYDSAAEAEIPTLKMLTQDRSILKNRAKKVIQKIKSIPSFLKNLAELSIIEDSSQSGGGALPEIDFPTYVVSIKPYEKSVTSFERQLRENEPPIIVRVKNDRIILDMRTIRDNEIEILAKGIVESLRK
ncbi:MAG: L-seryl-tRNA(Sec) selenium transferase [Thermodesulfovibrionales bacterium]|nr:L-seryl-tRNA(Sec) selenium transferase [Thermodesulfovibrionales bacterium]